jgi:arylsulfatase A-like enzyme
MTRCRRLAWSTLGLLGSFVGSISQASAAEPKPNFIVFLSDDVGWAEYGFQGGKDIPTPNIDSIARNGVRFPQGYVSGPYCSPTRAGLMTGRYQTRFGHEFNSVARLGLKLSETTVADRLKSLGYATCAVGKWHLGGGDEYRPMKRGFDEFYGTLANTPFFHPAQFVDSRISAAVQPVPDDNFYTTDAYADRIVDWLGKHQDRPWFLYVPFNAQHAPLQAPQKYLDRFSQIQDPDRKIFAAMMSAMDDAVGRVLAKVREMNQEDNTLIAFCPTMAARRSRPPPTTCRCAASRPPPGKEACGFPSACSGRASFPPARRSRHPSSNWTCCRRWSPPRAGASIPSGSWTE